MPGLTKIPNLDKLTGFSLFASNFAWNEVDCRLYGRHRRTVSPTEPCFSGPTFASSPPAGRRRTAADRRRLSCPTSTCASAPNVASSAAATRPIFRRRRRWNASPTAPCCSVPTASSPGPPPLPRRDLRQSACPRRRRCCDPTVACACPAASTAAQPRRCRRHWRRRPVVAVAVRPRATIQWSQSPTASTLQRWRPAVQPNNPLCRRYLYHTRTRFVRLWTTVQISRHDRAQPTFWMTKPDTTQQICLHNNEL